ncbi:MAG TPA: lytic transglycosylase domain-containing protein [Myxococcota bacterium]|nr:lytic transglycosylase domain-containing protein [Myxococcota bacterium]
MPPSLRRCAVGTAVLLVALSGPLVAPSRASDLSEALHAIHKKAHGDKSSAEPPSREQIAQTWDAFLTAVVKRAGSDSREGELRSELLGVLIEERYELISLLTDFTIDAPALLASLFESSWQQLVPLLDRVAADLPPDAASRYRSFVEGGDMLRAAERLGVARDLASSPESLRKLARILVGDGGPDPLSYDTEVDPDLREIFGFGPPLPAPAPSPLLGAPGDAPSGAQLLLPRAPLAWLGGLAAGVGDWLVPAASAAPAPEKSALVKRLNTWVPSKTSELREYVPLVREMLSMTADEAMARAKAGSEHAQVYRNLVLATAWQESCWRQFVMRQGEVLPLTSSAGSFGLMQINAKVWRGIYSLGGILGDIGYNGRAGSEILQHYLNDLALAGGEHLAPGGEDNLARATYAAYNGGPGHLRRYRKPDTSPELQTVDEGFWERYQAVKAGDERSFLRCSNPG